VVEENKSTRGKVIDVSPRLTQRLTDLASAVDLDAVEIARAVGTNPRTVSRWLTETTAPQRSQRERLLEVIAVLERLSATLRPEAAHDWLLTPNPLLQYDKPIDLLGEGSFRRVLGAIDALADGVFV
jgi:putative toxin-antitoxin system antitoxin component (TIGR02293 family)